MIPRKALLLAIGAISVAVIAGFVLISYRPPERVENQVWWIFSDTHVGMWPFAGPNVENKLEEHLEVAVRDVNELGVADYAICLGDMVSDKAEYVPIFLRIMDNLKVKGWHYVLGNHDHDWKTWENVLPIVYKGLDALGIRFILISDEVGYREGSKVSGGIMGDNQFNWFFMELYTYRDRPVFVFSHQPYFNWDKWDSLPVTTPGEVRVDIWFNGHHHMWIVENTNYGFLRFSISSVDWANNYNSVFLFLQRDGNKVEVTIRARDHQERVWLDEPYFHAVLEVPSD